MNVIFISPGFPNHFYNFCARLKERGVTVLGIGDCPWEELSENCKRSLSDYRSVPSLNDYTSVYKIVQEYISVYGNIAFVESQNEFWLELDARIRTDFHIPSGPNLEELANMTRKSSMKKAYKNIGLPAARWAIPQSIETALEFANKVGYPIIIKPDHGMGASDTHKLKNNDDLWKFWDNRNTSITYIEEECIPGHVETFDGITDSRCEVLFAASQVLPKSLMEAAHGDDILSYCQAVPEDLRIAGAKLLKEFNTKNRFFHFEFFRLDEDRESLGRAGDIVGLEVNMRAPGGRIPDKMNYAFETDVYTIWADSLIHDRCFLSGEFKHYITHIGRRHAIDYVHSDEQIHATFGQYIIEDFEVPAALAPDMGDHAFLLKADSRADWEYQINYILERKTMERRLITQYSCHLQRDMHLLVYGHSGIPMLAFPCQDGMCDNWESFQMPETLAPYIESGRLQLFTIDTIDKESWSDKFGDKEHRAYMQELYYRYIVDEALPLIKSINGTDLAPIVTGFSLGALHAAIVFFRRPSLFSGVLACSGCYSAPHFWEGWCNSTLYDNSPLELLSNMPKNHPYISLYNQKQIVLCVGQGRWEGACITTTLKMREIFADKGISGWVDPWGYDVDHDWPWWKKQILYHLPHFINT